MIKILMKLLQNGQNGEILYGHGIRYPNKKNNTKNTQFALDHDKGIRYNYIEARKNIYVKEYISKKFRNFR